jgi:hypothetical protein
MQAYLAEVSVFELERQVSGLNIVRWIKARRCERLRQKELRWAMAELRGLSSELLADFGCDAEYIALAKVPRHVIHPGIVVMNVLFKS